MYVTFKSVTEHWRYTKKSTVELVRIKNVVY